MPNVSPARPAGYVLALVLQAAFVAGVCAQSAEPAVQRVGAEEIYRAMRLEKDKGYALTATTNGGRFHANVYLQLARWARARAPEGGPLFINHKHFFQAYLRVTGLAPRETPPFVRYKHDYAQNNLIEYRMDRVVDTIVHGPRPALALSVKTWWADAPGVPSEYSYRDTLSDPHLLVINERVVTYRILDFGDMILFDDVHGVKGRPTSGFFGILFQIIGVGRVVQSRIAVSHDGLQVAYGEARKGIFSKKPTVTIYPDGRVENGIPPGRPDLRALEARLKQPLEISYKPIALMNGDAQLR